MTASWPAPAKLNLYLHVTGRRPDGYHTLDTLFQFLDIHDVLQFDITNDGRITRARDCPGVPPENDLTLRAARLLQESARVRQGVVIDLDKRLPVGGGLGGGSSDAASTLLALNRLWECGFSLDQLAALGLQLGADVPVFVRGFAARAEGVGEILSPAEPDEARYLVLVPPVAVSTSQVFAALDRDAEAQSTSPDRDVIDRESELTPRGSPLKIRDFRAGPMRNDLEPVVRRLYPDVDKALMWLGQFGAARMTGSGACVFLPVESAKRGEEILASCPQALAKGFVARGVNRHPLHALLNGD